MEITKYGANEVFAHIKHDLRKLPLGKAYGNESIDTTLTNQNYSLIDRGKTTADVNNYRKNLEKEIFKYNRKNLVHAVEVVIQCPSDCPEEQKEDFFKESFNHICSKLPMGERCVFVAEVHKDEKHYAPDGTMISKDHLHIMYVPAVKDNKHEGYKYKLSAYELTKKSKLKKMHPELQAHLDSKGIKATVFRKKDNGKRISFTVEQLKEITATTGIKLDHSITIEEFEKMVTASKEVEHLKSKVVELEKELQISKEKVKELEAVKQHEQTWGNSSGWGNNSGWGNKDKSITVEEEEEKLW